MEKGIIFIIKRTSNFEKKRKEIEEKLCNPRELSYVLSLWASTAFQKDSNHFQNMVHNAVKKIRFTTNALLMFRFSGRTKEPMQMLEGKYIPQGYSGKLCRAWLTVILSMCRVWKVGVLGDLKCKIVRWSF